MQRPLFLCFEHFRRFEKYQWISHILALTPIVPILQHWGIAGDSGWLIFPAMPDTDTCAVSRAGPTPDGPARFTHRLSTMDSVCFKQTERACMRVCDNEKVAVYEY